MSLGKLDHYSIRTTKLAETERFYTDVLGLQAGPRPEFKFPGIWLYNAGHAVVHVVGIDRANPQPLIDLSRREGAGGCRRHRQHRPHRFCRAGSGRHEGPLQRRWLRLPRKTSAQHEPGAAFPGRPERRHNRAELPRLIRWRVRFFSIAWDAGGEWLGLRANAFPVILGVVHSSFCVCLGSSKSERREWFLAPSRSPA